MGRGEGSTEWILHPNRSIKFSQKWPQKVVKYENFTIITQSGSKRKHDSQQEYVWHLNTQPEGVPEVKKGGLKGWHIPTDLDRSDGTSVSMLESSPMLQPLSCHHSSSLRECWIPGILGNGLGWISLGWVSDIPTQTMTEHLCQTILGMTISKEIYLIAALPNTNGCY